MPGDAKLQPAPGYTLLPSGGKPCYWRQSNRPGTGKYECWVHSSRARVVLVCLWIFCAAGSRSICGGEAQRRFVYNPYALCLCKAVISPEVCGQRSKTELLTASICSVYMLPPLMPAWGWGDEQSFSQAAFLVPW